MSVLQTTSILLIDAVSRQTSALPSTDSSPLCPTFRDHKNATTGCYFPISHEMHLRICFTYTALSKLSTAAMLPGEATVSVHTSTFNKICPRHFLVSHIFQVKVLKLNCKSHVRVTNDCHVLQDCKISICKANLPLGQFNPFHTIKTGYLKLILILLSGIQ